MDKLYENLISYVTSDIYPMHMPGHKRNLSLMHMENPYLLDITEVEGFDNLHQAEGLLKELSLRISHLYGSRRSYPLVNGSTAGILTAISAATRRGDKVLIARNAHKSVYHAVILMGLRPVYYYPPQAETFPINGGIYPSEIEELLISEPDIKAVIITSPTYEGVVSDINRISQAVHRHGAILIVDEAHGAHFGFHEGFPESAVTQGADLVIQSLHKTLPSFTQTAVLHSNREELNDKLQKYLSIYQSSSPSYLLMAGIDRCISILEERAKELFQEYYDRLKEFYSAMSELKGLKLADSQIIGRSGIFGLDPSKITISVKGTDLNGHRLAELLRGKYHIELEMAAPDYALGMTSICDTQEGFSRLSGALKEIDQNTERVPQNADTDSERLMFKPVLKMLPWEITDQKAKRIKLTESAGRISAAFVSLFPPGSPLLVPGELVDERLIAYFTKVKKEGITITGLTGEQQDEIDIVDL